MTEPQLSMDREFVADFDRRGQRETTVSQPARRLSESETTLDGNATSVGATLAPPIALGMNGLTGADGRWSLNM